MSDEAVTRLLRSREPLVVIEAAAGCGKTYQGASYAQDVVGSLGDGRLLILTHTHAACSVFADRTRAAGSRVEIRTIDALIAQIALAYHKPLNLPRDLTSWAWQNGGEGFEIMAAKVAGFLRGQPIVARALACRYPVIICDEHQDSSVDQHGVVMSLLSAGAMVRIFGDPMQRIYGAKSDKAAREDRRRWEALKASGASERLTTPHRWEDGCPRLGAWIVKARQSLEQGAPIDLADNLPPSVRVLEGNNTSRTRTGYQLSREHRAPIDKLVSSNPQMMILASQNDLVTALRAFWGRTVPIWEGHTREALGALVQTLRDGHGSAEVLAQGVITFMGSVAVGFSPSSHGDRLIQEVRAGAGRPTTGKPAHIQAIARCLLNEPTHIGVSKALSQISELVKEAASGFDTVKIDHGSEFRDAVRIGQFAKPDEGFAEVSRMRSYSRSSPPRKVLSSIHKAKGLECDHAMLMACDKVQFTSTLYAKSKLYVALSRAKNSLTLVVSTSNPSPLFKLP
ncbi:helicase [Burkholderia sp. MSh2]|uniref:DNA 3'-5' helicase II n=1 Tax=Burkholderia paludis TaxID=1506587 RepID=A0A6J5EWC6_9BURK|nr:MULTISPECIES: UvrD-helicase domain-containing protein [Burkholderia]KEZ02866.1 helicase [Burkholderia sp. MSh2]CAB3769472.1 RecBCD enzyme subunit RecB [Burkholderia paludis]VWC35577.1 RecBCD enzyme subunit RecB [Burkholderia paludis]